MSFSKPTPKEILERLMAEIDIALPGADARLRYSVESALARVIAMAAHELYGYLDWISKQILPITADTENLGRHGMLWGRLRKAASAATGDIIFTGTNGLIVPAGSILKRNDNALYTLDADLTMAAGVGTGSVTAQDPGLIGNLASGGKLNLASPVAGVNSQATVGADGLTGGFDIESDNDLLSRILIRIQEPPHGGNKNDYIEWAREVPGVTRAWTYPNQQGRGTVSVCFVMDNKPGSIIPSVEEVAAVQEHIDSPGVRPVTAEVTVFAPTAVPVDFEIDLSPNTLLIQNAVKAELADFFKREAAPGGVLLLSRIREAVSLATGEFDNEVVSPSANVNMTFGQLAVIGEFTFGNIA